MKSFLKEIHWLFIWRQSRALAATLIALSPFSVASAQETHSLQELKVEDRPWRPASLSQPATWTVLRSWEQYEQALPTLNASVTRIDAMAPGRGHISVCGDSGHAVFIFSSYMDAENRLDLSLGVVDMRSGAAREVKTKFSIDPVPPRPERPAVLPALRFDDSALGAFSLKCSPDASKVFVELNASSPQPSPFAKWLVLIDLKEKKGVVTKGTIFPSDISGAAGAIDTEAAHILAPISFSNLARSVGLRTVAVDSPSGFAVASWPRGGDSRIHSTASGFWVERYSQSVAAGGAVHRQRQLLLGYVPKLGEGAFTCGIKTPGGAELQTLAGELVLVQRSPEDRVLNVQRVATSAPAAKAGACSLSGVARIPVVPGQEMAVGSLLNKLVKVSYRKPRVNVAAMDLTFSRHLQAGEFRLAIPFHGLNEEEGTEIPIWAADSASADAATFVYGPVGRGTALIHFWRSY